ncbi:MAG: hypothetical protein RQ751_13490 [Longimicrobiales bacterium]|nr:hypothetical protein [Longimicrobiales bacterium]
MRDSAGVTLVENRATGWAEGAAWWVDAAPTLEVGTLDGPEETLFARLAGTALRSDGVVLVADAGSGRVSAFAPDGTFRWSQGRPGDGPGEYRSVQTLRVVTGDSALVHDTQSRRVTVLDPDGAVARTYLPELSEGSFRSDPIGEVAPGVLAAAGGVVFRSEDVVTAGRVERPRAR